MDFLINIKCKVLEYAINTSLKSFDESINTQMLYFKTGNAIAIYTLTVQPPQSKYCEKLEHVTSDHDNCQRTYHSSDINFTSP